jgi:predicted glycosyltransferase
MKTTTVPTFLDGDGMHALFITNECAGLGHLRRTINLARPVTESDPKATPLIVTGSAALGSFVLDTRHRMQGHNVQYL